LTGKILHADRLPPGERVADGDIDHPVLVVDGQAGGQVGLVDDQPVDQHVDLADAQRGIRSDDRDSLEGDLAAGVAGFEHGNQASTAGSGPDGRERRVSPSSRPGPHWDDHVRDGV